MVNVLSRFLISIAGFLDVLVNNINNWLEHVLFFKIYGFPFLLLIVFLSFIVSNFIFKFASINLFKHSFDVVSDKFTNKNDPGFITHSQAVYTEALSTLGIGSIAGVAIAINKAGPGALFWILVIGLIGTTVKFAEVSLAHKYRVFERDGTISGGPFFYIKNGLKEIGMPKIGRVIGGIYAVTIILGSIGASTLFQTNQTVLTIADTFNISDGDLIIPALFVIVPVFFVVLFGLSKITKIADAVIPFMTIFYIMSAVVILIFNYKNIIPAFTFMFKDAFSASAAEGGIIGSIVISLSRAMYVTTSGSGTSSIAHAPSKTKEHIREGCASFMDVFLSLVMCFVTGTIIIVTNSYVGNLSCSSGISVVKSAFTTISPYFAIALSFVVFLFAITTIIGWSYYGTMAWRYIFGKKTLMVYKVLFLMFIVYAALAKDAGNILKLCDHMWAIMIVPNLITIFLLSKSLRKDIDSYYYKLNNGLFKKTK